jgi:hypothetical protein
VLTAAKYNHWPGFNPAAALVTAMLMLSLLFTTPESHTVVAVVVVLPVVLPVVTVAASSGSVVVVVPVVSVAASGSVMRTRYDVCNPLLPPPEGTSVLCDEIQDENGKRRDDQDQAHVRRLETSNRGI